jgi:MoaA/NifB/PqqE/SkfB family radical SAM enzyme
VARGEALQAPLVVELDLTSFCDLACPECVSGPLLQQGRFSTDRILALTDEMISAGVRAVILIGGGEPLMHPAAGDVIAKLGAARVSVGLTTNGTQIHRYLREIADYVSWTRVSVDAATGPTYERFRPHRGGRSVFESVLANMHDLAVRKQGQLGYSYLVITRRMKGGSWVSNVHEIAEAARLAKTVGCDYFEVKPEYDLAHFLQDQPVAVRNGLRRQLAEIQTLADANFAVLWPAHLATTLSGGQRVQPKHYDRCPVAELRTLVTPHGAFICPYHRGRSKARYGDPHTSSFTDMWDSDRREVVMRTVRPSLDCRFHCIRHESNRRIISIAEDVGTEIEEIDDYDLFL